MSDTTEIKQAGFWLSVADLRAVETRRFGADQIFRAPAAGLVLIAEPAHVIERNFVQDSGFLALVAALSGSPGETQ